MRSFHFLLVVFAAIATVSVADAQLFRRDRSPRPAVGGCSNGSCPIDFGRPLQLLPLPAREERKLENGVVPAHQADDVQPAAAAKNPIVITSSVQAQFQEEDAKENFGVDWEKIKEGKTDSHNRNLTLAEALDFADGKHSYAKGCFRLVVIGTKEERKPVEEAFDNLDRKARENIAAWFVDEGHWSLKDEETGVQRWKTGGKPTVYLLSPDGGVLHRQDGWTGTGDLEAIRKGLKKYDPAKDPDLRKSPAISRPRLFPIASKVDKLTLAGCVIGAGGLLLYASKGRA